ncbi:MAG: hypothetical protein CMJ18_11915 [Phycisphaeraceae bacterium]|nr:hypothetical protein [Phycisphaeraceae bacterium]
MSTRADAIQRLKSNHRTGYLYQDQHGEWDCCSPRSELGRRLVAGDVPGEVKRIETWSRADLSRIVTVTISPGRIPDPFLTPPPRERLSSVLICVGGLAVVGIIISLAHLLFASHFLGSEAVASEIATGILLVCMIVLVSILIYTLAGDTNPLPPSPTEWHIDQRTRRKLQEESSKKRSRESAEVAFRACLDVEEGYIFEWDSGSWSFCAKDSLVGNLLPCFNPPSLPNSVGCAQGRGPGVLRYHLIVKRCVGCGYSLLGLRADGADRCPECGRLPATRFGALTDRNRRADVHYRRGFSSDTSRG